MPAFSPRQMVSDLRHARFNSAVARRAVALFYREGSVYTVPFGRLKGIRLQYDQTINFHAVLGLWETESFDLLTKLLASGILPEQVPVLCDVGANLGLYSMFLAHQYPAATVYAFEPALVVERLRNHLSLNHLDNVLVVEKACSDSVGEVEFHLGFRHHVSSLHASWAKGEQSSVQTIRVSATTLDDYFYGPQLRHGTDFVKMDIEGGGTYALRGCNRCIREKRPLFLIESHTPDEDRAVSDVLLTHSYDAFHLNNHRWVTITDRTYPDPDGIWGAMLLLPADKRGLAESVLDA